MLAAHEFPFQRKWPVLAPVILWMVVIFILSTSVGGPDHTFPFIDKLFRLFAPDSSLSFRFRAHTLVRKFAHVGVYALLSLLVLRAVLAIQAHRRAFSLSFPGAAVVTLLICAAYAAGDEFHQLFVPGRHSSIADVAIDSLGAVLALGCVAVARLKMEVSERAAWLMSQYGNPSSLRRRKPYAPA